MSSPVSTEQSKALLTLQLLGKGTPGTKRYKCSNFAQACCIANTIAEGYLYRPQNFCYFVNFLGKFTGLPKVSGEHFKTPIPHAHCILFVFAYRFLKTPLKSVHPKQLPKKGSERLRLYTKLAKRPLFESLQEAQNQLISLQPLISKEQVENDPLFPSILESKNLHPVAKNLLLHIFLGSYKEIISQRYDAQVVRPATLDFASKLFSGSSLSSPNHSRADQEIFARELHQQVFSSRSSESRKEVLQALFKHKCDTELKSQVLNFPDEWKEFQTFLQNVQNSPDAQLNATFPLPQASKAPDSWSNLLSSELRTFIKGIFRFAGLEQTAGKAFQDLLHLPPIMARRASYPPSFFSAWDAPDDDQQKEFEDSLFKNLGNLLGETPESLAETVYPSNTNFEPEYPLPVEEIKAKNWIYWSLEMVLNGQSSYEVPAGANQIAGNFASNRKFLIGLVEKGLVAEFLQDQFENVDKAVDFFENLGKFTN